LTPVDFSLIVPVFEEERDLPTFLDAARECLDTVAASWEVVVVDNASGDRTVEVAEQVAASDPRIRVLRNESNRGKGYSVRRGMLDATGRLRLICDADNAPSLASLPDLIAASARADVVIGSRNIAGSRVKRTQPIRRRIVGWGFIALSRTIMREPARDVYCGFKLFSAVAAEVVFPRTTLDGWTWDIEALAYARRFGFTVEEVAIAWINRPASKLSIGRVLVPVMLELSRATTSPMRPGPPGAHGTPPERPTTHPNSRSPTLCP
jgi:glycosyltransferase involved in cell wall biosynthesis